MSLVEQRVDGFGVRLDLRPEEVQLRASLLGEYLRESGWNVRGMLEGEWDSLEQIKMAEDVGKTLRGMMPGIGGDKALVDKSRN